MTRYVYEIQTRIRNRDKRHIFTLYAMSEKQARVKAFKVLGQMDLESYELLTVTRLEASRCPECRGRGKVRYYFWWVQCPVCEGEV